MKGATLRSSNGFPGLPDGQGARNGGPDAPHGTRKVGLWVFMAVVSALFMLFAFAYAMRMAYDDWRSLNYIPWQLWLSTALLLAGSVAWELARHHAAGGRRESARKVSAFALLLALCFIASQLAAWQAMTAEDYGLRANPANSFFYMITGLHGLHVLGGLAAGMLVAAGFVRGRATERVGEGIALCAQYWHFLFFLWLAVFALLFYVTPEVVRAFCTTVGIPVR
jgi:cytochrome c oxidase subunit 3